MIRRILFLSALFACSTSWGALVVTTNSALNHNAFNASASATDLINDGTSTLASESISSANFGGGATNNGSAVSNGTNSAFFANGNLPNTLVYTLDTSVNEYGYDLTEIQSIAGWSSNSTTHANQNYTIEYSKIGSAAFVPLTSINFSPFNGTPANANKSSIVNLTESAGTNLLATRVDQIRFSFDETGTWGNAAGVVLKELDVFGVAAVPEPSRAILLAVSLGALVLRRRRSEAV